MKNKGLIIGGIIVGIILIVVIYFATKTKKKVTKKVKDAQGNIVEVVQEGAPSHCNPNNPGKNYFGWESDACVNYYTELYDCDTNKPGWNNDGFPSVDCNFGA